MLAPFDRADAQTWIIYRVTWTYWHVGSELVNPCCFSVISWLTFVLPEENLESRSILWAIVNTSCSHMALSWRHVVLGSLLALFLLNFITPFHSDLAYFFGCGLMTHKRLPSPVSVIKKAWIGNVEVTFDHVCTFMKGWVLCKAQRL